MKDNEIDDCLKQDQPTLKKVIDRVRRHLYVAFGRHGNHSAEVGVRFEF